VQTTLRFEETLMRQAKAEAAKHGISLTRYIEEAIRQRLRRHPGNDSKRRLRAPKLPVSKAKGGFARGIRDLRQARQAVEEREVARLFKLNR
jgi:hypothetical protein